MLDLSFLAPPDEVLDWRLLVLISVADDTGLFDRLPGSATEIADDLGLDPHSVRVVLDALAEWNLVLEAGGRYEPGETMPNAEALRVITQHGESLSRWSSDLQDRMTQRVLTDRPTRSPASLAGWLAALGTRARTEAPDVIERCLQRFPSVRSVLDVAGGHCEYGIEAARRGCDVTVLDLPAVIDVVTEWPRVRESGVRLFAGDVFADDPGDLFDLVLCFGFTHTRPVEQLGPLFDRFAAMTAPNGGVAVSTFLRGGSPIASLFSVQMLIAGNGGDTHTLNEYTKAMVTAGFENPQVFDRDGRVLLLAKRSAS